MQDVNVELQVVLDFLRNKVVVPYNQLVKAYGVVIVWLSEHLPPDLPTGFAAKSLLTNEEVACKLEELHGFSAKSVGVLPPWLTAVLQALLAALQAIGSVPVT